MAQADEDHGTGDSEGEELLAVDITIYTADEGPPGDIDMVTEAAAEAEATGSPVRGEGAYKGDPLGAGGNSLWWPDRSAQVVQATKVGPQEVGEFLRERVGERHERLRIESLAERTASEFDAKAHLYVRPTGWRWVTLKIYPTPSANLTVIEMMPMRAWMPQTKRYLATGIPAITELTSQIEASQRVKRPLSCRTRSPRRNR